jgi:hypothetical protein
MTPSAHGAWAGNAGGLADQATQIPRQKSSPEKDQRNLFFCLTVSLELARDDAFKPGNRALRSKF